MTRLTLHEGDHLTFTSRDGVEMQGVLHVVPHGRRLWAGIREEDGPMHVVPRANISAIVNP